MPANKMITPEFITKLVNLTISAVATELFVVFRDGDNFMIKSTDKMCADDIGMDIVYLHKTADAVSFKKKVHNELNNKHVGGNDYKCTEVELLQAIVVAINNETYDRQVKMVREMAAIIDSEECRRFIGGTPEAAPTVANLCDVRPTLSYMIRNDKLKFTWVADKFVSIDYLLEQVNSMLVAGKAQPINRYELVSIMDDFATLTTKTFGITPKAGYIFN